MSIAAVDEDARASRRVERFIEDFVEAGRLRSVIVQVHHPVALAWEANVDVEHPAASLLKIPLVGALLFANSEHEVSLDHRLRPDLLESTCYPTVRTAFSASTLTLLELSSLAILTSDNAAASYVLEFLGVEPYCRFLRAAGCENTGAPSGFGDEDLTLLREARTTATDQLRILRHVWNTDCLRPLRTWMANNLRNGRLSARIEPPAVFAHKTGTLEGVVHDVGVLTTPDLRASLVVLTSAEPDPVATSAQMADLGRDLSDELTRMSAPYLP